MPKRSIFLGIAAVVLTIGLMGGSTYAYLTDTKPVPMNLTAGTVKIKVEKKAQHCACGHGKKQQYLAEWKIKNTGSTPVYLHSNIHALWKKGNRAAPVRFRAPDFLPQKVNGWAFRDDGYFYTGSENKKGPKILEPEGTVVFSLPFNVSGPEGRYGLTLNLKVTALQAGGSCPTGDMDQEETENPDDTDDTLGILTPNRLECLFPC